MDPPPSREDFKSFFTTRITITLQKHTSPLTFEAPEMLSDEQLYLFFMYLKQLVFEALTFKVAVIKPLLKESSLVKIHEETLHPYPNFSLSPKF